MPKHTRQAGLCDVAEVNADESNAKSGTFKRNLPKYKKAKTSGPSRPKQLASISEKNTVPRNHIIVGIDFGTSHSGISYVMSSNSDARDVQVVTDWTGGARKNEQLQKVPSKYAYACENEGLRRDYWGYEVDAWMISYTWFKLLLDSNATQTEFDNPHLQEAQRNVGSGLLKLPPGKNAQQITTDYLRCLYKHIMAKLAKAYSQEVLAVVPVAFWFTTPANWQDEANNATREASRMAGFGSRASDDLFMITEPEAAAIASLTESIEKGAGLYHVGMHVLIADLGGGTADFQCLTINSLDPLKTEEACVGSGGKTGSTYIDFNLHEYMQATFGSAFTNLAPGKIAAGSKFMEDFEIVKKTFTGRDLDKTFRINLPALGKALKETRSSPSSYDFEDGDVLILGCDIERMFLPIVEKALGLLIEQQAQLNTERQSSFDVIVLCGGLGTSEYIWAKFENFCKNSLKDEVHLITDERAWSTVVRGAAIRGLEGSIVLSKKARRCYGVEVHRAFQEGVDREEQAFECPIGGKRAKGYIKWLITKGKKFTPGLRLTQKTYVSLKDGDHDLILYWDLYTSAMESAPIRTNARGVEKIGRIKVDLRMAFGKIYKRQKISAAGGRSQEAVHIMLALTMGSSKGTLDIEALHKRTVIGKSTIDYEKDHRR